MWDFGKSIDAGWLPWQEFEKREKWQRRRRFIDSWIHAEDIVVTQEEKMG